MDKFEENIMFFVHDTFFYKDIIDSLPYSLAVVDEEGKIYYVNRAWKEFFKKFGDLSESDCYNEELAALFEEILLDQDERLELFISELKDVLHKNVTRRDIYFDVVSDGELKKFNIEVLPFYGVSKEEQENKDKIVILEETS